LCNPIKLALCLFAANNKLIAPINSIHFVEVCKRTKRNSFCVAVNYLKDYAIAVEQSKAEQQKANTERKNTLNLLGAEKGSVNELKAAIKKMEAEQGNINRTTAEGSKQYKQNAATIGDLKKSLKEAQQETGKASGAFGSFGKSLKEIPGPIGGIIQGFTGMAKAAWAFVANPIGAVIALLAGAVMLVVKAFKTFEPIIEWFERKIAAVTAVFTVFKESVVSLFTGQKKLNEAFDGMGEAMKTAAKEAENLKRAEQELDDMAIRLTASQAKYKRQMDELLLQSKNRTLDEKERSKLIDEALALEEKAYAERKAMADGEHEQALGKIMIGRNLTEEQKKNLREQGVAYAQLLQETKAISDEEIQALADAEANKENVLAESIAIREKALNRQYALLDAAEEKEKKRHEDYLKRVEAKKQADADYLDQRAEQLADEDEKILERIEGQDKIDQDIIDAELEKFEATLKLSDKETEELQKDLEERYKNMVAEQEKELAKQKEIDKAKADLRQEIEKQSIQIANDQFSAHIDNQLNTFKDGQNAQLDALKVRLENGQLSEADYEKQVKAIKLKVRQEEAKAEKKKALFDIGINTLVAVVKALPNVPLSLLVGGIGLASAASVLAKPEPKFAKGGIIGGYSHAQGGTHFVGSDGSRFEAERGEAMFVLNKNASAEIAALSQINESHGGRSFFGSGSSHLADGGEVSPASVSNQIDAALRNTPIIVRVGDISTGLTDMSNVKEVGVI